MQIKYYEGVLLGLDIGQRRIGVARADTIARLPEPLDVIDIKKQDSIKSIIDYIKNTGAKLIVAGLPLLASGDDSAQTVQVREFMQQLAKHTNVPHVFVDEAHSSQDANDYIKKSGKCFTSNDSVAACIILERYFETKESKHV